MSKPISGHFSGTMGSNFFNKNASILISRNVIISVDNTDYRAHPTKYKQMTSKKRKLLKEKANNPQLECGAAA